MALRGMLTQNIDRKEAEDYSANTDERKEPVQKAYTDKELSVENEQIICPGCGKVLDETSKFCRFCGIPLVPIRKLYTRRKIENLTIGTIFLSGLPIGGPVQVRLALCINGMLLPTVFILARSCPLGFQ